MSLVKRHEHARSHRITLCLLSCVLRHGIITKMIGIASLLAEGFGLRPLSEHPRLVEKIHFAMTAYYKCIHNMIYGPVCVDTCCAAIAVHSQFLPES